LGYHNPLAEGSLEVKLPTIRTDEKQRWEESEKRREEKKKENTVFPMICGSGGSKSRLAKAAGVEPSGQMRDDKLRAVAAQTTFQSQNAKNTSASEHFWKLRCRNSARRCGAKQICKSKCTKHILLGPLLEVEMSKKWTPLWRSTCPSQNAQSTPGSEYFWKLRCRKSARRCGAKHMSKSKCLKHHMLGSFLKVQMWLLRGRRKGFCILPKVSKA